MDNQKQTERKESKRENKTVFNAFTPVGAPRDQGSIQYYSLYGGQSQRMSDRGGENHAR